MSRFPRLRKTIQILVLAALPLGASACCGDVEDYQRESTIDPDSPEYKTLVDACLADDLSCEALCTEILRQQEVAQADEATFSECRIMNAAATQVHMTYSFPYECIGGRRPAGLSGHMQASAASPIGTWLAQMAHLEAASIYAFANTARQLARHGAPRPLIARSIAAMAQEIDHARTMAGLARRWGAQPPTVYMTTPPDQSLFELCLDNAVEGCVRETFGAVVATYQAQMAGDVAVRAAMRQIACDETEHAETSFAIDAWARAHLDREQRDQIDAAKQRAIATLTERAAAPIDAELTATLGVPGPAEATRLVGSLRERIWA